MDGEQQVNDSNINHQLVYRDFRKTLSVALFTFVLLTAFLLKDNDLVSFAMFDDGSFKRSGTDCTFGKKSVDIDLLSRIRRDLRHAKRHTALDRKLLATCSDNCVTHYSVSSCLTHANNAQVEKLKV